MERVIFRYICELKNSLFYIEIYRVKELYMHDANTTSFKHYCFAYDLKDLAEKGLYFIEGRNAKPAQLLITFVDFVKEFIS